MPPMRVGRLWHSWHHAGTNGKPHSTQRRARTAAISHMKFSASKPSPACMPAHAWQQERCRAGRAARRPAHPDAGGPVAVERRVQPQKLLQRAGLMVELAARPASCAARPALSRPARRDAAGRRRGGGEGRLLRLLRIVRHAVGRWEACRPQTGGTVHVFERHACRPSERQVQLTSSRSRMSRCKAKGAYSHPKLPSPLSMAAPTCQEVVGVVQPGLLLHAGRRNHHSLLWHTPAHVLRHAHLRRLRILLRLHLPMRHLRLQGGGSCMLRLQRRLHCSGLLHVLLRHSLPGSWLGRILLLRLAWHLHILWLPARLHLLCILLRSWLLANILHGLLHLLRLLRLHLHVLHLLRRLLSLLRSTHVLLLGSRHGPGLGRILSLLLKLRLLLRLRLLLALQQRCTLRLLLCGKLRLLLLLLLGGKLRLLLGRQLGLLLRLLRLLLRRELSPLLSRQLGLLLRLLLLLLLQLRLLLRFRLLDGGLGLAQAGLPQLVVVRLVGGLVVGSQLHFFGHVPCLRRRLAQPLQLVRTAHRVAGGCTSEADACVSATPAGNPA